MTIHKKMLRLASAALLLTGLAAAAPALAQSADLSLAFATANSSANFGASVTYSLNVTNAGADAAAAVTVSGTLPVGAKVTGVTGCTPASGTALPVVYFPCAITGTVASGATKNVKVTVAYAFPDPALDTCPPTGVPYFGAVTFTAASTTTDPDTANNTVTRAPNLTKPLADLEVAVTGPASISRGGGTYTYNYTVTNHGPCAVPAVEVAVDDSVATGFTWVSATGICGAKDAEYLACSGDNNRLCSTDSDPNPDPNAVLDPDYDCRAAQNGGTDKGTCVPRQIDGDFLPDGSDYQYCDGGAMAVGDTHTGTKTYHLNGLASDLISSNQGTGLQMITYSSGPTSILDPVPDNNVSDVTYVLTKSMGCSTTGGGTSFLLLAVGLGFLFLKRRK